MIKRLSFFFDRRDEEELSTALTEAFPALKFIDGESWPEAQPPITKGIHRCESTVVYLWPSDAVSELPVVPLPLPRQLEGKRFQGPSSGPVIQFARCKEKDGQLELGQLCAYIDDAKTLLADCHKKVLAFVKKRYSCAVDCLSMRTGELLNENVRGYLVGLSIQTEAKNRPQLVLAFGRDEHIVPKP